VGPVAASILFLSFQYFLSAVTSLPHEVLMAGDFSIHFDEIGESHTQQFMTLDSMAIVKHYLSVPTWYHHSHSLDVVITVQKKKNNSVEYLLQESGQRCSHSHLGEVQSIDSRFK
jgi:hypothetical protein